MTNLSKNHEKLFTKFFYMIMNAKNSEETDDIFYGKGGIDDSYQNYLITDEELDMLTKLIYRVVTINEIEK